MIADIFSPLFCTTYFINPYGKFPNNPLLSFYTPRLYKSCILMPERLTASMLAIQTFYCSELCMKLTCIMGKQEGKIMRVVAVISSASP